MSSSEHPLIIDDSEDDRIPKPKSGRYSNPINSTEEETEEENKPLSERNGVRRGSTPSPDAEQGSEIELYEGVVPNSQESESPLPRRRQSSNQPHFPIKTFLTRKYANKIGSRKNAGSHNTANLRTSTPVKPPKKAKRTVRFNLAGQSPLDNQLNHELVTAITKTDDLDPTLEVIPGSAPEPLTQNELEEMFEPKPALPRTDNEMARQYHELKEAASAFVQEHFPKDLAKPITVLDLVDMSRETPELMEFINYITSPCEKGWEYHFRERKSLLVYGVLGKLMQAHFFGQEMFGASDRQLHALRSIDWEMLNRDGFARQQVRACTINGFLSASDRTLPPAFISSISRFHAQILALLAPLRTCLPTVRYQDDLRHVLLLGAKFSLDMRREPGTIYHITTMLRDTAIDRRTTRTLNPVELDAKKPWHESSDSPIVRLVAWPEIVAYRAGNGRDDDDGGPTQGCRTRTIDRAEVYTEWGRETYTHPPGDPDHNPSLRDFVTAQAHAAAPA